MANTEISVEKVVAKLEGQLELWGAQLKVLVAKGEVAGQQAKIDSRKHLDELMGKLDSARSKLAEAKAAGADKWDGFKQAVESSWEELEGAFKKLVH